MALAPAVLAPQASHVFAAGTAPGWQEAVLVAGIDPVFLAEAGWDPVRLVLSLRLSTPCWAGRSAGRRAA